MNNTGNNTATPNQREIAALEFARLVLPEDMTTDDIVSFRENMQAAAAAARPVILSFIRPALEPAAPSLDVRVEVVKQFVLGGLRIEAVRVTYRGEGRFRVKDAIRAADTDGRVVRSEEQWKIVYAESANMPFDLDGYWLVTARPGPDGSSEVSSLDCAGGESIGGWSDLEHDWNEGGLVLRLCP